MTGRTPTTSRVTGGRVEHAGAVAARLTVLPDYLDAFTLATDTAASPTEWMTACFEQGVERSGRDLVFNRLLRLRTVADGTSGHVAGWRVVQQDAEHLTVAAEGPWVAGDLVLEVLPGRIRLSTAIEYRTRRGRLCWGVLSAVHRRKAPGVLRTGEEILRQRLP